MIKRNRQYRIPPFQEVMEEYKGTAAQIPSFDEVMAPSPKKKEDSGFPLLYNRQKVGSIPSRLSGTPQSQSVGNQNEHPDILTQVNFKKNEHPLDIPESEIFPAALNKINDIMYGEDDKWKDPLKAIDEGLQKSKSVKETLIHGTAKQIAEQSLMPTGYDAKRILATSIWGQFGEENQTAKALRERAKEYDKNTQQLKELEPLGEKSGNAPEMILSDLKNQAIKWYADKDPQFKRNLESSKIDLNDPFLEGRIPSGKVGSIMNEFLSDPDNKDYIKNEKSNLAPVFDYANKTILTDNPQYGINVVANKVSQAIQKTGYNNIDPIFNFNNTGSKQMANLVAEDPNILTPQELEIYNKHIRDHQEDFLDKPSLFEGVASGAKDVYKGIGTTLSAPFNSQKENIKQQWIKEASNVSADPEGFLKHIRNIGHVTGFVTGLIAGGEVLGGTGLVNPATAQKIMIGTSVFGNALQEAESKYKSPVKAWLSAAIQTGGYIYLNNIFPTSKISKVFSEVKPELNEIAANLATGKITKEAAKQSIAETIQKGIDFGKTAFKQNISTSAELTALSQVNRMVDKVFGLDEQTYEKYNSGSLADEFATNFLSNSVVAGMAAAGESRQKGMVEKSLLETANNPRRMERYVEDQNPSNKSDILDNIKHLERVKQELDRNNVPIEKQGTYLVHSISEKANKELAENSTDPTIQKKYQEKAKRSSEIKDGILKGIPEDKIKENQAISTVKDLYNKNYLTKSAKESLESKKTEEGEPKFDETKVKSFLEEVAQNPSEKKYPKQIIELANEMFPEHEQERQEIKSHIPQIENETKTETTEIPVKAEATPADEGQAAEAIPTTSEGQAEPPESKPPVEADLPFGKQETSGIAHESQKVRAYDIDSGQPERGEGVTVEEAVKHGQDLLDKGADPNKAAEDFQKDQKISYDALSLVRAKQHQLERVTNQAIDKFGDNSKEAQVARKEERDWYNNTVKPMQTEWSKIGTAQQGEVNIDTGSYAGLRRAKEQATGKELTAEQAKVAKEHAKTVEKLTNETEKLKEQITKLYRESSGEAKETKSYSDKAKTAANALREKAKLSRPGSFSAATPASLVWDSAIEVVAKSIEAGGKLADAVAAGINHIKESDWYKGLTSDKQKQAEEDFTKWHEEEDKDLKEQSDKEKRQQQYLNLAEDVAWKKDNKFTPEQTKAIWEYARKTYIDNNPNFRVADMVNKVAMDLGLSAEQVRHALAPTSTTKKIIDQMYRNQYEKNKAHETIKQWVNKDKGETVKKLLDIIASPFRNLATLGHGHALLFTHAGMNLTDPQLAKRFFLLAGKQFKLVYGNESNYEKAASDLRNDPMFTTALRAGLAVDPNTIYDDWQLANNFLKRLKIQGNKGFLVLKMMRMEVFKNEVRGLSNIEKADKDALKNAAQIANHWTGTAGIPVSPAANALVFAPNFIVSKFARLTTDPAKALFTYSKMIAGKDVSTADKAAANIILRKSSRIMVTYLSALAANQALLSITGSNQKVNFTNPFQSDWLKFKTGGKVVDISSGMASTLQFLTQLFALPAESKSDIKKDYYGAASAGDALKNELEGQARKMSSPFGSIIFDMLTHQDFQGNSVPWSNDKPRSGREKLSVLQYVEEKLPIPISEAFSVYHDQMRQGGVDESKTRQVMTAILIGAIGSAGIKVGNEPNQRPTPYTEDDKKDPTFKYFLDKGMELPNTSLSSEKVPHTKLHVSDFPKEIQDKYSSTHKEFLKEELDKVRENGVVYIDTGSGEVSLTNSKDREEKDFNKLSKEELVQVLHLAQANATIKAKKELFNND